MEEFSNNLYINLNDPFFHAESYYFGNIYFFTKIFVFYKILPFFCRVGFQTFLHSFVLLAGPVPTSLFVLLTYFLLNSVCPEV